jgi:hypothetical protein
MWAGAGGTRGAGEQRINLDLSQRVRTGTGLDHDFAEKDDLLEASGVYSPRPPMI